MVTLKPTSVRSSVVKIQDLQLVDSLLQVRKGRAVCDRFRYEGRFPDNDIGRTIFFCIKNGNEAGMQHILEQCNRVVARMKRQYLLS